MVCSVSHSWLVAELEEITLPWDRQQSAHLKCPQEAWCGTSLTAPHPPGTFEYVT